ncbi:MAG: tetratricopeptide repeat protein [Nitrosopumilus sp.]|nr:tetratricopeptide repeat protein [Nitrosopumilus sp.]MBT6083463.1 tetratricopeptide repeat protein [Nitrosopumilus sp.]MBT6397207.1 tetratricopeptide repeat protein [Nitrosopumilus sp.]MBT7919904.1 tetratricopeptide repeat protein [Nitrosopumilus sp.]
MNKLFGKKNKVKELKSEKVESEKIVTKETSLVDPSYNIKKLFKKGVNLMADEKLDDAIEIFEQALRIEPDNVEILMKVGYARFHLEDHLDALKIYDKVLEIDITNPEAWNLKGLVHYEQRKYAKALDAVNKAIDSDKTYGMAWYNKACFLSLLNQVPESLQALKHAIEIDVKNARKSIRDKDFANVRIEEGFKRIQEVVVLESVKQGYHTLGAIVWTTFLDKIDAEVALRKLLEKGLIVQNEKRDGLSKIPVYDLADNIADKIGKEKIGFFGLTKKKLPKPVKNLKAMSQAIHVAREAIEEVDIEKAIKVFDEFIEPTKSGEQMIENFFEEHREIRLWKIRIKDRGEEYIIENKEKMLEILDNIEVTITKKLRDEIA